MYRGIIQLHTVSRVVILQNITKSSIVIGTCTMVFLGVTY